MKTFIIVFALTIFGNSLAHANACHGGDRLVGIEKHTDTFTCTAPGYCWAYDFNPQTGRSENFWGYHNNCEGVATRDEITYQCQDRNGFMYYEHEVVVGICEIQ